MASSSSSSTPSYLVNATAIDFKSVQELGNADISEVFEKIASSELRSFFNIASREMFAPVLSAIFSESSVSDDKVHLSVDGKSVDVDEAFFGQVFNLPNEGISSFADISAVDIEEMQVLFSSSGKAVKISEQKRKIKFHYQLLADVVAKGILAKAGTFAALTMEKFQVMTAIVKGIQVNWTVVLFSTFKNMFQTAKQSKGFGPQLCYSLIDELIGVAVVEQDSMPNFLVIALLAYLVYLIDGSQKVWLRRTLGFGSELSFYYL